MRTQAAQQDVRFLGHLSDYLHAREDRGEQPSALTREDMTGFLSWLQSGVPAKNRRHIVVSSTRRAVQFARRHLTGPGQPAAGIGGGFQLYHEDLPCRAVRDPDEPGRALPRVVLAQLLDEELLAPLGDQYLEYRLAFELIAHTGRRPGEICSLAADCLRYDEEPAPGGGKQRRPVLRYRREKPPAKWAEPADQPGRRRPDRCPAAATAGPVPRYQAVEAGAASAAALQPDRAAGDDLADAEQPRDEVGQERSPPLLDEDGSEFGHEHVYLYALRHSYAQRHADAGVPLDTLQKLMDHRTAATTQIYYRVTWARKREAIERVSRRSRWTKTAAASDFTRRWSSPSGCARRSAGSRSRSGYCTEQHNVRALGAHCPFSHQCLGCEHFRTDPSHLPDLYAYLERLLETRERLRAAVPQLAEWARTKAIPADAEIRTVRTLIRAGEGALDELAPGERAKLLELFRVLRATRARMDGTIGGRAGRRDTQPRADVHCRPRSPRCLRRAPRRRTSAA